MKRNTTYYTGAGASYNSIPILTEFSNELMNFYSELSHLPVYRNASLEKSLFKKWVLSISTLSENAKKFNTIDTYARKLNLNNDIELKSLKEILVLFLTYRQSIELRFENRENAILNNVSPVYLTGHFINQPPPNVMSELIDHRYISLLVNFLNNVGGQINLDSNINFITWNYDLQIELAFSEFYKDKISLKEVNDILHFNPDEGQTDKSRVCHLNGFAGYNSEGEYLLDDILKNSYSKADLYLKIEAEFNKICSGTSIIDTINFAWEWETSVRAKNAIERAKNIIRDTEHLVIIGYSFPVINRQIDQEILGAKSNKLRAVYLQSLDANERFFRETFSIPTNVDIYVSNSPDLMNQFIIPHT